MMSPRPARLTLAVLLRRLRDQLPEHEREDAAVPVVFDLDGRVDAQRHRHLALRAVGAADAERHVLPGPDLAALEPRDVDGLRAVEPEGLGVDVVLELEGEDDHADEVRAVYALEALGDDGLDAEQESPLRRPVARRARAVLLAREDDERHA